MRLAFRDPDQAIQFMGFSGRGCVRPDEFWFNVCYFCAGASVAMTSVIFELLDTSHDGYLDREELAVLMASTDLLQGPPPAIHTLTSRDNPQKN